VEEGGAKRVFWLSCQKSRGQGRAF